MNFIHQQYISDISVCDRIIEYHDKHPGKYPGQLYRGDTSQVDKQYKDSLDCQLDIDHSSVGLDYIKNLREVSDAYVNKFTFSTAYDTWGLQENVLIQRYEPGGGFHAWHCERGSYARPLASRHLVFMTYLNDVTDDGETHFFYQDLKVQPRKGLTLIWPADWTHTHKGITSPTQVKYIVTGWFSYLQKID